MADHKMGRPTDNPKNNRITIRLDNKEIGKLNIYKKSKKKKDNNIFLKIKSLFIR